MRLTHIKLAGFKSFVDPTTIPVPGQVVAIVGPNGCGKSNVIDAVRWVLGETSARQLRGESMQDVIFNGSGSRKPVGRASVELCFDNSLGRAPGQWSNFAEITVKRVVHRDGESQYFINNLRVRRRDVTDIFLGTGLGPRAYAIIEQGMISRIIEARPEELRVFLEEAAGVSKYKERRRETEARLKDTRENLLRVDDVRQELEKQLARLESQAQVARHYHGLNRELTLTQNLLTLSRRREAAATRERLAREVQRVANELEAETARLRQAEAGAEHARAAHYAAGDALHAAQGELYSANAEVARIEQGLRHQRDSRERLATQINGLRNQQAQQLRQRQEMEQNLGHWREERAAMAERLAEARERLEADQDGLPRAEAAFRAAQTQLAELQKAQAAAEQALRIEETHLVHAQKTRSQLQSREARLRQELQALPPPDHAAVGEKAEELALLGENLAAAQMGLDDAQSALPQVEAARREALRAVQAVREGLTRLEAQLQVLEQLQKKTDGDQRLADWLAAQGLQDAPRLWQRLRIEPGWEDALESVLGERLNALELASLDGEARWLQGPPGATLALYEPGSAGAGPAPGDLGLQPLAAYVAWADGPLPAFLADWLHGVHTIDRAADGLACRQRLAPGACLVTREGHRITRHGVSFFAPQSEMHGVLARSREIERLRQELDSARGQRAAHQGDLDRAEADLARLQQEIQAARTESDGLRQRRHRLQLEVQQLEQQAAHQAQRRGQVDAEIEDLLIQIEAESERILLCEDKLELHREDMERLRERVDEARQARDRADRAQQEARDLQRRAEHTVQEAAFNLRNCENRITEGERTLQLLSGNAEALVQQLEELLEEQAGLDDESLKGPLDEALAARVAKEAALVAAREALAAATDALQAVEQARLKSEHALDPLRERLNDLRLKEQEARIGEEQLAEQLREAQADETELEAKLDKARPAALSAEIVRLQQEIQALGAVNLAAVEELATESERKRYLDAQAADLTEAMETLEQAIRRIDRETRDLLQETFEKVNANLGELFPTLFGGGQARLMLTGEEILDAGLQVIAQPPGKKNSTIHLLSGGEKALTAVSLTFSLFRLNPAPFCMLDEVDAPLDDSNAGRLARLVSKMSEQTQFLFISHNKISMEIADQLVGVTMQEQGVSRMVAVDMEEALRIADSAAA